MRRSALASLLVFLVLLLAGCGGSGGGGSTTVTGLTVGPASTTLVPGGIQIFTATLNGGYQPVVWSVVETNGGTIDSEGRYTAPRASGTYTVKAALKNDATKSATTRIIVDSRFAVTVTAPATIGAGRTKRLTATVSGASDPSVTWTTSAGTISPDGTLAAPSALGNITVTATSVADPGKSKSVTIRVAAPLEVVVPAAGTLALVKSRLTFTALVDGAPAAVDWGADDGIINQSGRWIAPNTPGTFRITATRRDDPNVKASVTVESVDELDVRMEIEGRGEIIVALHPGEAPNTCANFVSLINESFYDGIIFHRYEPGFVVQGGDPLTRTLPLTDPSIGTGGPGYTIPFESNNLRNEKYSLAMARAQDRNSGGSQVYFNLADNTSLDGNYVVFGGLRSGTEVVDALRKGDKITRFRVQRP